MGEEEDPSFEHQERIVISPILEHRRRRRHSSSSSSSSHHHEWNVPVSIESKTIQTWNSPQCEIRRRRRLASWFPKTIENILLSEGLERLLIQLGSSSSSSWPSSWNFDSSGADFPIKSPESSNNNTGPAGISIYGRFSTNFTNNDGNEEGENIIQLRMERVLRQLSGMRLVCAPLDAARNGRNHHPPYPFRSVGEEEKSTPLTFHISFPFESHSVFCNEGLDAMRSAFGPCSDGAGIFAAVGSHVLVGLARHSSPSSLFSDPKRSLWMDAQATSSCHAADRHTCTLSLRYGMSYTLSFFPSRLIQQQQQHFQDPESDSADVKDISLSLADLLLGGGNVNDPRNGLASRHHQQQQQQQQQRLYLCPLADSSELVTINPKSSSRAWLPSVHPSSSDSFLKQTSSSSSPTSMTTTIHDLLSMQLGHGNGIDMYQPLIRLGVKKNTHTPPSTFHHQEDNTKKSSLLWSIDRIIQRPNGIANVGSFHTVIRYDANHNSDDCNIVQVHTMDLFPRIISPILHSLTITIHQGGGAGSENYHPSHQPQFVEKTTTTTTTNITTLQLWDIPHSKLTFQNDGSIVLELSSLNMSPDSSFWISGKYRPKFLSFEQFPPDPNRGMELLPSYAIFVCNNNSNDSVRLYSKSHLLLPPVPDMTMPYNVSTLSITFYVFIVGGLLNALTRKSSRRMKDLLDDEEEENEKKKKNSIRNRIRSKISTLIMRVYCFGGTKQPTNTNQPTPTNQNQPTE